MKNAISIRAVIVRTAVALGLAAGMLNCQVPLDRPDANGDMVEFQSVWQYLRAFSIHQGAIPPDPFVFETPEGLMAMLHDTLKNNNYTVYYPGAASVGASAIAATASAGTQALPSTVFLDRLTDSTAVITDTSFDEQTWRDFKSCAMNAVGYPNIIIDLRQNKGGQLDVLDSIIAALVPLGTRYILDSSRVYDKSAKKYKTTGYHALTTEKELLPWFGGKNKKYVVIMDNMTASASEILCAALYEGSNEGSRTKLIGTRSYGKAMGQIILDRRTRKWLQITFLYLKGVSPRIGDYHRVGITPDPVPDSIAQSIADSSWSQWKKELFYALKMLEPGVTANSANSFHAPHINASPSKMAVSGLYRVIKEEDVWQ